MRGPRTRAVYLGQDPRGVHLGHRARQRKPGKMRWSVSGGVYVRLIEIWSKNQEEIDALLRLRADRMIEDMKRRIPSALKAAQTRYLEKLTARENRKMVTAAVDRLIELRKSKERVAARQQETVDG